MQEIAIFRQQLFKFSEPFIAEQVKALRHFSPFFLGRIRLGCPPGGVESLALEDIFKKSSFCRRFWHVTTRATDPYLQLLGGHRPNLIHAHFGVDAVYALPLARRLGVPLITTFHGFDATVSAGSLVCSRSPSWGNYALFRRQLAREGDLFLCVSAFIRQKVLAKGFPEDRTHVHYIGIDTQAIQPRAALDESLNILHVARLVEKKGTEFLIRAFAGIAQKAPRVQLIIIGDGPLKRSLQKLVSSLDLDRRVRFLGARTHSEVMDWIAKAVFVALPSVRASSGDSEGLGMVLLEAGALGVPLIGTRHGGIPEAIIHGQTGYLVAERNVGELAARMGDMLADPARRAYMGARARALVETRFDIRRQTDKLEAFYRLALE